MVINRYFLKNTLLFLRAQELNIGISSTNMLQCVVVPLATFLHILRVVSPTSIYSIYGMPHKPVTPFRHSCSLQHILIRNL